MQTTKAARRYSSALLQVAREKGAVEEVLEDVKFIRNTIEDSRELVLFLKSPIVKKNDKEEVLNKLFKDQVQEITFMFLDLMIRKDRENLLGEIAEAYIERYNEYAGIQPVNISTAYELSDDQKEQLREVLEKKTGKTVEMHFEVDRSLKGGMAVRIEDTVIDGTVSHKLDELHERLLQPAV
jgi:F-type H+-transporting ATPase subunit delta